MDDLPLRSALDLVVVRPPLSASWGDTDLGRIPRELRRSLTEEQVYLDLENRLTQALYANFYSRGFAVPTGSASSSLAGDPAFVRSLSRANAGAGYLDPGWRPAERNGSGAVFTKHGLAFTVGEGSVASDGSTLRLPKERLRLAPGFYMAFGNRALGARDRLVRVYWNVDAHGAPSLVGAITRLMNRSDVPFRFKVVNHPDGFERCDAGVLWIRRKDGTRVWPLLEAIRRRVRRPLRAGVPAFTKRIASGVAVAEEPPGAESFGMNRSRLVARGLIAAAAKKRSSTEERLREIAQAFLDCGLDLERPFLNPRSRDVYPPLAP